MRLTRGDASLALQSMSAETSLIGQREGCGDEPMDLPTVIDRLHAVAEAIYPAAVEVDRSFVSTYVTERRLTQPAFVRGQAASLASIDRAARRREGCRFVDLSPVDRRGVLQSIGARRSIPDPNGSVAGRMRYYVFTDLLGAFLSTPTGCALIDQGAVHAVSTGDAAGQRWP